MNLSAEKEYKPGKEIAKQPAEELELKRDLKGIVGHKLQQIIGKNRNQDSRRNTQRTGICKGF